MTLDPLTRAVRSMEHLRRIAATYPDAEGSDFAKPFALRWGGARYVGATNRHILLVEVSDQGATWLHATNQASAEPQVRIVLDAKRERRAHVDRAVLVEWAGAVAWPRSINCPGCRTNDVMGCDDCDAGIVTVRPDARPGLIGSHRIDRNLVAMAIEGRDDEVFMLASDGPGDSAIGISGDGWLACVMPMRADEEDRAVAPRLPLRAVAK